MTFSEFLERYIFVRKCILCRERLSYEYRNEAFCDACRISFERAKTESCSECNRAMVDCKCLPQRLENVGIIEHRKLFPYRKSEPLRPENRLVLFLKDNKSKRVANFAADQLRHRLDELLVANNLGKDDVVITFIPRSRRSYAKSGVDQAELVAKALSEVSGIRCLSLIKRLHDGKAQKKLSVKRECLR